MGNDKENAIQINMDKIIEKLKESGWDITKEEADKLGKEEVMKRIMEIYRKEN